MGRSNNIKLSVRNFLGDKTEYWGNIGNPLPKITSMLWPAHKCILNYANINLKVLSDTKNYEVRQFV